MGKSQQEKNAKMKRAIVILFAALFCALSAFAAFGCSAPKNTVENGGITEELPPETSEPQQPPEAEEPQQPEPPIEEPQPPVTVQPQQPTPPVQEPQPVKAAYIMVEANSVNIRSGAGAGYSVLGSAVKGAVYILTGRSGSWLKTTYKNKVAYISADYCSVVYMQASSDKRVETVIAEGGKCLGVPYVYGATRYLDENGKRIASFSATRFDCSSLMQYVFKLGANINLKLTTRTQIYQGTTIKASQIRRGDLLFFTNDSRKDNVGIERVGHVALYLGDNYILHTASDYAKIEQISSKRWGYFIQAQRIL